MIGLAVFPETGLGIEAELLPIKLLLTNNRLRPGLRRPVLNGQKAEPRSVAL
jgi:hypothetical protein